MTTDNKIRITVTVTGDGSGERVRVLEASPDAVDVTGLMARVGVAFPEFETVDWHTDYLADTETG